MRKSGSVYDQNSYYAADGKGSRLSRVFNPILLLLDNQKGSSAFSKIKRETDNVLDIGAGDGKFLAYFKKRGFNCFGTTASATSKDAAKDLFQVDLEYTTEIPKEFDEMKFDLISHWHVFEHLENPNHHAEAVSRLLAEEGVWIVEVPNIESTGSRLCYRSWLGSDPVHHINHMPQSDFAELINKHGLGIQRIEHFSLKFTYVFLWSALLGRLFGKLYSFSWIMDLLKTPFKQLRQSPLRTINAFGAIFYLFPFILSIMLWQGLTGNGEIKRYYIRRLSS